MKRYTVTLTKAERKELQAIVTKGSHKSQKVINALILLADVTHRPQKSSKIALTYSPKGGNQ